MDVLEIVLTMLSMAGAVFAWYQASGSKKARAEAADAVSRAEVQAKSAFAQAYEARKQAEATQRLADSLKEQVAAAEKSVAEAQRANKIAKKRLKLLEKQVDQANESNHVVLEFDESEDEPGLVVIQNVGSGFAHDFEGIVLYGDEHVEVSASLLPPGGSCSVLVPGLKADTEDHQVELERYELALAKSREPAPKRKAGSGLLDFEIAMPRPLVPPMQPLPSMVPLRLEASWRSPAGRPQDYRSS